MKNRFTVRSDTDAEGTVIQLPFADRIEAGSLLAQELAHRKLGENGVVLALARGGVPVGAAIADRLGAPLDVILARKIGVPWQPELAMGAIAGSIRILDEPLIRELGVSRSEVEAAVAREEAEIRNRELLYRGGRTARSPLRDVGGHNAILVDDGLATGSTMLAAVRYVRTLDPARVIVAVPIGSREACKRIGSESDQCVCLATPEPFNSVGEWYLDFQQVSDVEVREMLFRSLAGNVQL
jgi:putative phosphoribosyl transferase